MADKTFYPQTPLLTWADDAAYPAGPEDWAEGPTKIETVDAVRAVGMLPDDQIGAQQWNWLIHRLSRLTKVLAHHPLQNWHAYTINPEGDDPGIGGYAFDIPGGKGTCTIPCNIKVGSTTGSGDSDIVPQQPLLGAFNVSDTGDLSMLFSAHGLHWVAKTPVAAFDPSSLTDALSPEGAPEKILMLGFNYTHLMKYSDDLGTTFSLVSVAHAGASPTEFIKHFHQCANGRIFAAIGGGDHGSAERLAYSDTMGATWTFVDVGSADYSIVSMADDGGSFTEAVIVAVCNRDPWSPQPAIIRSTDNGLTWNLVLALTAAPGSDADVGHVAYSPVWEQFLIWRPIYGEVYTSANGTGWIVRQNLPSSGVGFTSYPDATTHVLGCVGSVFMFFANMKTSQFLQCPGVWYSLNCGTSWHFVGLGDLGYGGDPKQITNLKVWGGRFLLSSPNVIYYSDPVWAPSEDILVEAP